MAIKFQDSLEVKGGSASKIYLEGAGGTGSSTILQAYNPDDGAGHGGGTAYLKSSGWGEAQLAVGSYRWTQAGGKMTVTGGVYYFNTGNVGIKQPNPTVPLEVIGTIKQKTGAGYTNYVQQSVSEAQITFDTYSGNQSVHPNAFKVSHNGSDALVIDKDSNVGIGNYTPESRLHIYQSAAAPTLLTLHNYQGDITPNGTQGNFIDLKMTDNNATFTPQVRIGMLVQDYDGDQGMPSEGTGNFVVYTGDGTDSSGNGTLTEKLRVTHQGAVGINQSNPEHRLDIVSSSANVLGLTNTSNGTGTTITFNDNPTANQRVYLTAHHVDSQSHGGGASLHLTSTEANVTMVSERYKSIQHGDSSQWSAAYSWGDHSSVGYLRTRPEVHSAIYSTGGNADEYTEFGIYRNYAEGGPITSHNTILNVMQQDGRYGFQLGANTTQDVDGLYYRSKDANIGATWYRVASTEWVQAQGYLTSETDSQTLSFNDQSGELTISNGNTVDLDSRYFDATGRKKWYNISAASGQAKRYRIARVYYCPQHWDDTWQNIEFELLEEGYNASYVKYSLFGYYNGTTSQTLNLKVTDFRGLGTDTQRYNMFLGDHTDAGWEHSGRPVFFTDIFVDVSYYKGLKITADTFGHTYQNTDPTSGAAITVFYDSPDVVDIDYTNVAKTNTYVGDDAMIWNTGNFTQTNVNNWNTAYGWGNHSGLYAAASHTHSAADITSGTLNGNRLPWQSNDAFTGTYPIVWKATGDNSPYTSSWLNINGSTDTLHARNIHADGKITSTGPISVNNRTAISVAHWSSSGNSTGAIKIKLPGLHSSNNWSMVVLRITTYEYNSNEHTIYYVSGHDWVSGWYNKKVTIIGESDKPLSLTYSESANEDYVIIGDITSTWSYGHVTVDVMAHPSFYSSAMDITTGWTIEQIEDLADIELRPVETKRVANEQWVIDQGYLTSYTETDTIDSVLSRGSTTSRRADFLAAESIRLKGIRGQFTNEYIHLYSKVGIGHPSGWGQGEDDTPSRGLSTYGAISVAYGASATSYFNGNISFTGNSRKIYLTGGDTNSQNGWVVGEQDRYGFGTRWNSGSSLEFEGWWSKDVTTASNRSLGSVNVDSRIWNFSNSVRVNGYDVATQAWVEEQPPAPAAASCAVVGDTIEVSFDPAPESPDYYQVWASQDGGSYSLIAQIPTQDFSPFMTVVDTSFSVSGLRAYRVYAVRRGIYSDPATTSRTYTQAALEPVNMNVVPMEESFFVQWDAPASRFVDHYEVYLDTHADQGSLNRNNANLVYSGNNTFYMHPASTNEFHQFWVEIAES